MKTTILSTILFFLTVQLISQQTSYQESMKQCIGQLERASGKEDFLKCAGQFERIASAEKTRWIPYYYASYALVQLSFDETDNQQRDLLLDRAQELLDRGLELAPDESELHVLQAFLYPSRIMVNPMARGMVYIERSFASLDRAKALNPENPRIYFLEAMNRLNLPPAFGGGAKVAKPLFQTADEKYGLFHNDDPLWPNWGAEANREELAKLTQ